MRTFFLSLLLILANNSVVNAGRTLSARECSLGCASNCAQCVNKQAVSGGGYDVLVDLASCKGSSMSWMCCKNKDCSIKSCDGALSLPTKCDEVTHGTFFVPEGQDSLLIEIHDGAMAGNVDCSTSDCCGGSPGSCSNGISGVCRQELSLSTCTTTINKVTFGNSLGCAKDADCLGWDVVVGACEDIKCVDQKCVRSPKPLGFLCRDASDTCDTAEYCDGVNIDCPIDKFMHSDVMCRDSTGVCDIAEYCTGTSSVCPSDGFLGTDVVCRAAVVADDGTSCDVDETCNGLSAECPSDAFKPSGIVCRSKKDKCDVVDTCQGGRDCPSDLRKDTGYTYKCGNVCYLCSVLPSELTLVTKSSYKINGCGTGSCETMVQLMWPDCMGQCVNSPCQNNRGLSNVLFTSCDKSSGAWNCTKKVEVGSATLIPVCV
jgi:hypothetical protein